MLWTFPDMKREIDETKSNIYSKPTNIYLVYLSVIMSFSFSMISIWLLVCTIADVDSQAVINGNSAPYYTIQNITLSFVSVILTGIALIISLFHLRKKTGWGELLLIMSVLVNIISWLVFIKWFRILHNCIY